MVRKLYLVTYCALFIVLSCGFAEAGDESTSDLYELKEILVTESKYPQDAREITHKIDIVDEDLNHINLNNRNLSEAIKYLPGNFVNPLSRNDANWGSYGGLGPKYNSWLLDGLPIDSFVDPMSLDLAYIDRIEVHRGPASVLYPNYMTMDFAGNETPLSGITNLITKEKVDKPFTSISVGYGSWDTIGARAYHEGNVGDLNFILGANYEQSDYTNYGTKPSWLNMIDDPNYNKIKAYMKTTYFLNPDTKISLFGHHTQHSGDTGRPNRDYDHQYDIVNLIFSSSLTDDINLQVKGGYRYYNRSWEEDNYPTSLSLREEDGVKQNIFPSDIVLAFKHWGKSILNVGFDSQYSTYETYSEVNGNRSVGNDVDAKNFGVYVQEKVVYDKWVFRVGARYNYVKHDYDMIGGVQPSIDDKSWDKLLWSAGVRYNFTDRIGVYTNAGSSFLAPSAKSVGGTLRPEDRGVPGKNGQLPNPDLKPEEGLSFDLGADMGITDNLYFGLRGFYHIVKDTIVTNVVSTDPSQSQDINAGKSYAKGIEVEVKYFVSNRFKWFANFTYTDTEVKNSVDINQNKSDVPFVPDFVVNTGVTVELPYVIMVSPFLQYVGKYYDSTDKTNRREFGDYFTGNLNIQKPLFFGDNKYCANVILELNNIFDKKYEMPWQFQDPGFNAMLKVELQF